MRKFAHTRQKWNGERLNANKKRIKICTKSPEGDRAVLCCV